MTNCVDNVDTDGDTHGDNVNWIMTGAYDHFTATSYNDNTNIFNGNDMLDDNDYYYSGLRILVIALHKGVT